MKNIRSFKYYLSVAVLLLIATGCNDFLSGLPQKSQNSPVERVDQLEALMNNPTWRAMYYVAAYSTDDAEFSKALLTAEGKSWSGNTLFYYTVDVQTIPNLTTAGGDPYWADAYANIFKANLTIEHAGKVSGDEASRKRLKAEAHFVRAYYMWEMANTYCLPYAEENMDEPGLPRRFSTDMEENYAQMTLKETYAAIDEDIEQALLIDVDGTRQAWRGSKGAVYAFLSRYYLNRGEYDKVIEYADLALDPRYMGNTSLYDYNDFVAGRSLNYTNPTVSVRTCESSDLSIGGNGLVEWQEFYYMRWIYNPYSMFMPSQALINLFGDPADYTDANELKEARERDLRFYWFFNEHGNRALSIKEPMVYRYNRAYRGGAVPLGVSVQEVMLNKAEAMVRQGGDYNSAMSIINELRLKRCRAGATGINLTATDRAEALRKILEERRRELPFSHRWWDIRRFAYNETPEDDVTVVRDCFELLTTGNIDPAKPKSYTLEVKSRRYALPFNNIDVLSSNGRLKQHTY
jgi:hypothetical protein